LRPGRTLSGATHPLTDRLANERVWAYESSVRESFGQIVPVLKEIASHRCEPDFTVRAQSIAGRALGLELPAWLLDDAWITGLDMRRLFAWTVFAVYRKLSDDFYHDDPLGGREGEGFQAFLLDCGFHLMDVTPCADGRLAHAISYVLRLPYGAVRRKSYAGALFDIENTVEKWVETEFRRFREGLPNTADAPTRYLKTVLYHRSSGDPAHQGCAAHGSDDATAARAGWERLRGFRQAIENGFCCGASVDLLLIGMDTDTDAIRVHVPDGNGHCDLDRWLCAVDVYEATRGLTADTARERIAALVRSAAPEGTPPPADGMVALIARLIEHNLSQLDYVRAHFGGSYPDQGHAERFIGAGIGFEEIQLRNLMYFAYLGTVEEGAADLDVGIRIFTGLNLAHGLPIPVVVRHDYHGNVPGARERAVAHCERISSALAARYPKLRDAGMLHCLRVVRDCDGPDPIEIVGSSVEPAAAGAH
jgi:carboxysome shell carbonic anhydrase